MGLYDFQKDAIRQLLNGKHIVISNTGCLAEGTPVRLANGEIKNVENISQGDLLLSYDEITDKIIPNTVDCVIRSCDNPKPMIQLSYDGERITTTYDHYFYTENGFAPLYELVWGALETSQRLQLQLLCKQYGQNCDHNILRRKRSFDNETRYVRQVRVLEDSNGREDSKSSSGCSRNLVEKPVEVATSEPHQLEHTRQQSGQPRVVFKEIQCVSWMPFGQNSSTKVREQHQGEEFDMAGAGMDTEILSEKHEATDEQLREGEALQKIVSKISESDHLSDTEIRNWSIKIKTPAPYYSICMREAPYSYCIGREHNYIVHNSGKGAMAVVWARATCKRTGKKNVLVVSTASKANMTPNDFELDADKWNGEEWRKSLSSFSVISWHKLSAWVNLHWRHIHEWVFVFDEIAKAGAGVSSGMGRAFLKATAQNKDWAGFTATPGDVWLKFYPYFQATGLVKNKTQFIQKYCTVQTHRGFPEITDYRYQDELKDFWKQISTAPDTSQMMAELPSEQHKTISFKKPKTYDKTIKTLLSPDGEMLETSGALCAELRRQCFTKEKQQWLKDFVENLGEGAVMFYNFIKTGDELEALLEKTLPKGAKIWRIDGKHHDIPTRETIGKYDIVLCQWQSGSEALNLQFLRYWVGVELCYSYSTAIQARGRIKRIGQTRNMFYYYLLTKGTIEQAILKCLQKKGTFSEEVWTAELQDRLDKND